jgi:hypothetical protein
MTAISAGRWFTRKGAMWDCEERHLKRRNTDVVPCPVPKGKSKGMVLEVQMRHKYHAKVVHGRDLRPKVSIRVGAAVVTPLGERWSVEEARPDTRDMW